MQRDELLTHRALQKVDQSSEQTSPNEALELARVYLDEHPGVKSLMVVIEPPEGEERRIYITIADCTYGQANHLLDLAKMSMIEAAQ